MDALNIFGCRLAGTAAANLNLLVQTAAACGLVVGGLLAWKKRFKAHQACQIISVLCSFALFIGVMAPSFLKQVAPPLRAGAWQALKQPRYAWPLAHAVVGALALLMAFYVLLSAATALLPERYRLRAYKPVMRATLAVWLLALILGLRTYHIWYAPASSGAAAASAASPFAVRLVNFAYEPKEITVAPGTTVEWFGAVGEHTIEWDDGAGPPSGNLAPGAHYRRRFDVPGRYPYHCDYHGDKGGKLMAGVVIVAK